MSNDRPWYKRYGSDFIAGTLGLSLEEKGAYSLILDLLYDRGRPLPDDPRYIAGVCGCSVRKWNAIRERLIEAGKITVRDGTISNPRFDKEAENAAKISRERAENGAKGGNKTAENRAASSEINDIGAAKTSYARASICQKLEPDISDSSLRSESDAREAAQPLDAEFADWYAGYPHKVGKAAALKAFRSARRKADLPVLQAGVARYIREKPPDRPWCNPATWLNQERWNDQPAVEASGGGHGAGRSGKVGPATAAINAILGTRYGETREPEFLDAEFRVVPRQH